jgi:hypothetical protein
MEDDSTPLELLWEAFKGALRLPAVNVKVQERNRTLSDAAEYLLYDPFYATNGMLLDRQTSCGRGMDIRTQA